MALAKTIFVRRDKDGDDEYLLAYESLDDVVEDGGISIIGVYHLEKVERYRKVSQLVKSRG